MTERITLSIKPEKRKLLERLARQRHSTMSGVLETLLDDAAKMEKNKRQKPLLGDLLSSLTLKDDYKAARNSKELLAILRNSKAQQ